MLRGDGPGPGAAYDDEAVDGPGAGDENGAVEGAPTGGAPWDAGEPATDYYDSDEADEESTDAWDLTDRR
jgi:hypothetical protein